MSFLNVEIKARCNNADHIRKYLLAKNADFKGVDTQTDTYFYVPEGRLKLREGNIENNLIFYKRENSAGPKNSLFKLVKVEDAAMLKEILIASLGVKVVVEKNREIYYINNVKLHLDSVPGLGDFVEIEAGNLLADLSQEELAKQCNYYISEFEINQEDMVTDSYSDMMLRLV